MKFFLLGLVTLMSVSAFASDLEIMSYSFPEREVVKPNQILQLDFSYRSNNPKVCYNILVLDNSTGEIFENSISGPAFPDYRKFSKEEIAQGVKDFVYVTLPEEVTGEYDQMSLSVGVIITEQGYFGCRFYPLSLVNKKVGKTIFKDYILRN